jgi:8-hydroxy-5-deazaflavin:NADPH oxidoreductase
MKKIGILGTGMVGNTMGTRLIEMGYEVKMGSRSANNKVAADWVSGKGSKASAGTFAEAAAFGEVVFICLKGDAVIPVIKSIDPALFNGKIVIDISNPLDFSKGMPPSLLSGLENTNSLGEEVQKTLPGAKVVKTLNIVNTQIMVTPDKLKPQASMFVAGNDEEARKVVTELLKAFGWQDIHDLGDITAARAMEMMLPIWVRILVTTNNPHFGFRLVK